MVHNSYIDIIQQLVIYIIPDKNWLTNVEIGAKPLIVLDPDTYSHYDKKHMMSKIKHPIYMTKILFYMTYFSFE